MSKANKTAISPRRDENYPEWYQQVIRGAELAEPSPVRGCMVIKPWGYTLWENIQRVLDGMFKETGHENAYFPLFIPMSFLEKEAQHVEGFAKECAVVTHHRLEVGPDGKLHPAGPLEEPLVVRPTSETIIGAMFAKWVQSYRDLPLLINQWANVVRWEMRPRMFLRTTEFLWQEVHTVHATEAEAWEETAQMLGVYAKFAQEYLAMPVLQGEKTESERFPGAVSTYCIEALMQDRKALQAGTSHFLGRNFSQASEIKFLNDQGQLEYAWTTSWGVSTRLIGGLLMTHSDDDGLVLPPRLAPRQVVILPVLTKGADENAVIASCRELAGQLAEARVDGQPVRVQVDTRDMRGGEKMWSWVRKGVPLRVEIGPREIEEGVVSLGRRDREAKERQTMSRGALVATVADLLENVQKSLYERASAFQKEHTRAIDDLGEFNAFFTPENPEQPEIHGGFALAHWNGDPAVEAKLNDELGVTIRCIPFEDDPEPGRCLFTGEPSRQRVVFAKSY